MSTIRARPPIGGRARSRAMAVCEDAGMSDHPTNRRATDDDLDTLIELDHHVRPEVLQDLVDAARVLVAEHSGVLQGWRRWSLFWDEIPFMNMLFVMERSRNRGVGGALVGAWEDRARTDGHRVVMSSTRSDESAQHFYRGRGYVDCGVLLLPAEPAEVILRKEIAPE